MMSIYYIYGKEAFLLDYTLRSVLDTLPAEQAELTEILYLETDGLTPFELSESLQFSALFVMQRVVIIRKPAWLTADKKKAKYADDFAQVLKTYLAHPEPGQTLILTAEEKPAGNQVVKLLEQAPGVQMIAAAEWTPNQIKDWIRKSLAASGKTLDEASLHRIVSSGQDLYYIKNLLDKLALFDFQNIPPEFLEMELDSKTDIKIFKLLDGVLSRNVPEALTALHLLLAQGEAAPYILFMLSRQLYLFAWVKALHEEGGSPKIIEEQTGQKSFTVKNLLKYTKNFTWDEIEARLDDLLKIDSDMKSTAKDTVLELECLLPKFARR